MSNDHDHVHVYEVESVTLRNLGGRIAEEISTRVE